MADSEEDTWAAAVSARLTSTQALGLANDQLKVRKVARQQNTEVRQVLDLCLR